MKALEDVFQQTMPKEMGFDYFGMSYQEQKAAQGVPPAAIFGLSLLFVFLILAAQYESWSLPFSVLFTTPIAVFGAFAALSLRGMQNNLYAQIGLVMLIGLAAKNAILIVEFANQAMDLGMSITKAAAFAGKERLRPILMTAISGLVGFWPLVIASGAGAMSRWSLGTAIFGGYLISTVLSLFLVPVLFVVIKELEHRFFSSGGDGKSSSSGKGKKAEPIKEVPTIAQPEANAVPTTFKAAPQNE
jgi:HAE1 family hydrophobic/amphiphilic exporter-1